VIKFLFYGHSFKVTLRANLTSIIKEAVEQMGITYDCYRSGNQTWKLSGGLQLLCNYRRMLTSGFQPPGQNGACMAKCVLSPFNIFPGWES
jgi:hypothetical protein